MKKSIKIIGNQVLAHVTADVWFDRTKHQYYHVLRGDRLLTIPSVTRILQDHFGAPRCRREVLRRAGQRGKDVHQAYFLTDTGRFDPGTLPDGYRGYYRAFTDWRADYNPTVKKVEFAMYDPAIDVAGTCDLVADFPCIGREVTVDYKTGEPKDQDEIQLAAYMMMMHGRNWTKKHGALFYPRKDGRYTFPVLSIADLLMAGTAWDRIAREYNKKRHSLGRS